MRRSLVNAFVNQRRRERLMAEPPEIAHHDDEPRDEALWRLLATLPRRQRAVLVLRFYEDLTEVEISHILGCSVGTVKSNSSRAGAAACGPARTSRRSRHGGG